jgi:hypothetical protein
MLVAQVYLHQSTFKNASITFTLKWLPNIMDVDSVCPNILWTEPPSWIWEVAPVVMSILPVNWLDPRARSVERDACVDGINPLFGLIRSPVENGFISFYQSFLWVFSYL